MDEKRESTAFYEFVENYSVENKSANQLVKDLNLHEQDVTLIPKALAFMMRLNKRMNGTELRRAVEFLQDDPMSKEYLKNSK